MGCNRSGLPWRKPMKGFSLQADQQRILILHRQVKQSAPLASWHRKLPQPIDWVDVDSVMPYNSIGADTGQQYGRCQKRI